MRFLALFFAALMSLRSQTAGNESDNNSMKKKLGLSCMLLTCLPGVFAATHAAPIPKGSKIYVNSNNGFDTFILAALQAKHARVELVSTEDRADFILDSSLFHTSEFVATQKVASTGRTSEAAFKLTSKSGDIIWAYAVTKGILSRGKQSVAEACAKHLKDVIQK